MNSLFDILKKIQNRNPVLRQRIEEASALDRWEKVVGPHMARHTRTIRVQDAVLWVEVDHPIWKSELHHRKRQILDRLNAIDETKPASPPREIIKDLLLLDPRAEIKRPTPGPAGR